MKNILILMFVFLTYTITYSQPSYWSECNSGVTTTLTSAWALLSSDAVWVCGYSGTVLKSTNFGFNWVNLTGNGIPTNVQLINICGVSGNKNIALTAGYLGSDTWVWRTTNGGINWVQVFYQASGFINSIWMFDQSLGFMMGDPVGQRWSLWKTTNGGFSWDSTGLYLPQAGSETGYNNSMFCYYPKIWFGTNNSRIYYSTNLGNSWIIQTVPEVNSFAIAMNPIVPHVAFFGGVNLYRSTNQGTNWILINSPGSGNFGGISTTPLPVENPQYDIVWYVRSSNVVYISYNGGENWSVDYTNPTTTMVYRHLSFSFAGSKMFAVGTLGKISVRDLPYHIKKINSEIPIHFNLFQNYPNPFNQSTIIEFECPYRSRVVLEVYDISGRLISTLINDEYEQGKYQIQFTGAYLTSGVYFYRMVSDNFSQTKRMIIIK
ncbi:MAG: T9SS type A sorting domain-containing protein [Ignavibacteria bacterium]|nr:T9SS type A sorting domain-containing protein [Ignavibacteria bacterium]